MNGKLRTARSEFWSASGLSVGLTLYHNLDNTFHEKLLFIIPFET